MQDLRGNMQFLRFLFPQVVQLHYLGEMENKASFDCLISQ